MGMLDDAKETVGATAKHVGEEVREGVDRAKDKMDEMKADAEVRKAEAERDSVRERNEAKERLRD